MKKRDLTSPHMLLMLSVLLGVVFLTSCSRGCSGSHTPIVTSPSPVPMPQTTVSPAPVESPTTDNLVKNDDELDEASPRTIVRQLMSSVRQLVSAVFRIRGSSRPLNPGRSYSLKSGDRIKTNDSGTAEVNIADCMTVYVYEASGLTLSTCPGFARGSAVCSNAGTSLFNNKCRSHIRKIETSTAEISLEGTWLRVAYWPEKKRTIIDVHEGPVQVRQFVDANGRTLGEPVEIKWGCWCAPSDRCFVPGVPTNGPRPCTDLTAENKSYLARTKDKAAEQANADNKPIAPEPRVGDGQVGVSPYAISSLDFGEHQIGIQTIKDLSIENISSLPLKLNEVLVADSSGNFQMVSETCRAHQVELGNKCTISVAFKPQTTGQHEAILNILDNAKGSPRRIFLRGRALSPTWHALVGPTLLDFQDQPLGVPSGPRIVEVMNSDSPSAKFGELAVDGAAKDDFKMVSNTCKDGVSICAIEVVFKPTAVGERKATLVIPARLAGSGDTPQKKAIELRGVGTTDAHNPLSPGGTTPMPHLAVADDKVCFKGHKVVDPDAVQIRKAETITIANKGDGPLVITRVTPSNDDFVVKSESCTGRRVTDKCEITVGFTPRDTRTRVGLLTISSNDAKTPVKEIPLAGRGKHRNWFIRGLQWVFRINQKDHCKP